MAPEVVQHQLDAKAIGSTLDIIRIQRAVCHYSEYCIYTENISGWPTALLWYSPYNSTKPEYFAVSTYWLAFIVLQLHWTQYTVLRLLAVIKWAHTLQPQLVLHGIKIIRQTQPDIEARLQQNASKFSLPSIFGILSQVPKPYRCIIEAGNV